MDTHIIVCAGDGCTVELGTVTLDAGVDPDVLERIRSGHVCDDHATPPAPEE